MSLNQIILIQLRRTLTPETIQQATQLLNQLKSHQGFTISLMLIADNQSIQKDVKMSALVYLKNCIQQSCKYDAKVICEEDMNSLKSSILQMMIKTLQKKETSLVPTLKYICYLFAKYHYSQHKWSIIEAQLLQHINACSSLTSLKAALSIIKIIFQIVGKSLTEQVRLNNFSNKIILPLITFASKMFADLSGNASSLLDEVLKIFTQAIEFHLPEIIEKNIHMFMVLIKNILDIRTDHSTIDLTNSLHLANLLKVLKLKKQALKFLQKMYQRHSTSNLCQKQQFVESFNQRYTKSFFQTIIGIIINQKLLKVNSRQEVAKHITSVGFQVASHSLGIFSFVVGNRQSLKYINEDLEKYQLKILYLSMQMYLNHYSKKLQGKIKSAKLNKHKENMVEYSLKDSMDSFQNYTDFVQTFRQQRQALRHFLSAIFNGKNSQNRQQNITQILQLLLKCISQGSVKQKQLGLYLLCSLQKQIQLLNSQQDNGIYQKTTILLTTYVFPLLTIHPSQQSAQHIFFTTLTRQRAFEMYARFDYLQLSQQHCCCVCQLIFSQLLSPATTQPQFFLKVQAIQTFNTLLSSQQQLVHKLSPNIPQILRIYTEMLSQQFEIMRFYEEILGLMCDYIAPIVYDLLDLLVDTFFKLTEEKIAKMNCLTGERYGLEAESQQEDQGFEECDNDLTDSDEEYTINEDDIEIKYESIGSQCLGAIKMLVYRHELNPQAYVSSPKLQHKLLLLIMEGLSSGDQSFARQCLGILNLLIYKSYVCEEYHFLLPALLYPIYISKNAQFAKRIQVLISSIKGGNSEFQAMYKQLLEFVSHDAFCRAFQLYQLIGCVRNFVKILGKNMYSLSCPVVEAPYVQLVVEAVYFVEQAGQAQNYSSSERLSVLALYQALLENKIFQLSYSDNQIPQIGFKQDKYCQACLRNLLNWEIREVNSLTELAFIPKFKDYCIRLLMLAIHQYPFQFFAFSQKEIIGQIISHDSPQYPFNQFFSQIKKMFVDRLNKFMKQESGLNQLKFHTLSDSFIMLRGLLSLGDLLMKNFVVPTKQENFSKPLNIIQAVKPLITQIFYSYAHFILQVVQMITRQFYGDKCPNFFAMSKNTASLQQQTSIMKQKIQQEVLINMLNDLSMHKQSQYSINPKGQKSSKSSKLQVEFQFHLKHQKQIINQICCDESNSFSSESEQNPFGTQDEEYLYAYDSPLFGSFTQNRKQQLKAVVTQLVNCMLSQQTFQMKMFIESNV